MNRIMTALALSGLFIAAPAFAKATHQGRRPVVSQKASGEKGTSGEKTAPTGDKAAAGSETKVGGTDATATEAKPVKKTRKSTKKSESSTSTEKPAEAPAK